MGRRRRFLPSVLVSSMAAKTWTVYLRISSNAGGGGERVLWAAIRATQKRWPKAICVVYSGDHDVDRPAMIERVKDRFGITLHAPTLVLLYLSTRHLVLASTYPRFTLLGQSLGSLALAYDAFSLLVPDIFIDTMGYAFTLAFCHYLFPAIPTAAYVHYPTISTDMLESLNDKTGKRGVNAGAGAGWKGKAKRLYWHLFALLYGWVGSKIDLVMCNSSWTRGHITALWKASGSTSSFAAVVWPPCAVEEMETKIDVSAASEKAREKLIVYIAQFRPEKNHSLVLRAFAKYYHSVAKMTVSKQRPKLVLIGSVRSNTSDDIHIYNLRLQARELKIEEATTFICDASFSVVLQQMQKASIGVNGMWNEHFGIGVVEYLAAGLIPVVHDSGGPKLDIVVPFRGKPTGYHAETDEQFAKAFGTLFAMSDAERLETRQRNRESAKRFTEEAFAAKWITKMEELVKMQIAGVKA
jgi:alpha-1,2-mannosyltransferase